MSGIKVVRDLQTGGQPVALDLIYNQALAADGGTLRYKGSLVKLMDYDDVDHGVFATFGGLITAGENVLGILEEEATATTGEGYLLDDATYGGVRRRITPIFPSTLLEAEYVQSDSAGTDNTDTGATASAAGTTFTVAAATTDDYMIGGWIYFVSGSNANYLHYVTDSSSGNSLTFATAVTNAVASGDTWLCILPPYARACDFNATYTGIKSEVDDGSWADSIMGINTLIQSPSVSKTYLERDVHDGLYIPNARFFHQFTIPQKNAWINGMATS